MGLERDTDHLAAGFVVINHEYGQALQLRFRT
jgi:hypothetical protein